MPDYSWPPMEKRKVIGKRISRLDGMVKSTGAAKYNSDINPPGLLFGVLLTSPHGHARIKSIDTSEAERLPGVTAVRVILGAGKEIQWQGQEIASLAAVTEDIARDAARKIKVDYEILEHFVDEEDLAKAGSRAKPAGEVTTGDPDKAFQEADAISQGYYAIPVITHCCLEPHGQTVRWRGERVDYWPSTQNVSALGAELARSIKVPVTQVHTDMQYMGGGFGSKFPADLWGTECAELSKASGGRPVKMFLDRQQELLMAGNRPSVFGEIKVGAKKDGSLTVWQSKTWASGGLGGGNLNADQMPYVYRNVPNRRINHTAVSINAGSARAWRAPNNQQLSYITCCALDDLAAKLGMDSLDFFIKNTSLSPRGEVYKYQLEKGAEIAEWKKLWKPRGTSNGPIKRGLGIGVNMWGGLGHDSKCRAIINPDGSVEVQIGTQDLGVGTRTIVPQVAAETLGLPMPAIKFSMGSNAYPPSGASGGSTTVGGVTASTRKATVNALNKLFEVVAPSLGVPADQLEAVDRKIQVKGNPAKSLSWQAACAKLGVNRIEEMGENVGRTAPREGLISQGAAGIQIADVSVDIETGKVKLNRLIAVQDCGLIVNPKLAESQIFGACIMSTCGALYEERVMDQQIGKTLNADMEFYKLSGINDIGEIIVHLDLRPEMDKRGVIGLGEPPAIGGIAAIANAVANAVGVRVHMVPLTPNRVLEALARRNA
ncbi:MAG: xanthine dehydrogenase family protein molybdopterin-binding subunit [Acidobacteria bacterium]|nr:xanthine dehydrogenase family protein molybdopterin-binding subunit [Acidobacteriota bacterium]